MITAGQYADLDNEIRLHYATCGERGRPLVLLLHDGLDELVDDLAFHRLAHATHWLAHEEPDAVARRIFDFIGH